MIPQKALILVLIGVGLVLSGCGYTQQVQLPRGIQTIYVETVQNKIPIEKVYAYEPGLEVDITNAVIRRIHRDGNLRVVPADEADTVLQMRLIGFEQEGLRFNSLEAVEEFRMFVVVSAQLVEVQSGDQIWAESNFTGDAEYIVSDVRSLGRAEAKSRAIDRLARNIVDRIVEDW